MEAQGDAALLLGDVGAAVSAYTAAMSEQGAGTITASLLIKRARAFVKGLAIDDAIRDYEHAMAMVDAPPDTATLNF